MFSNVTVACFGISFEKHPHSSKMSVCNVSLGILISFSSIICLKLMKFSKSFPIKSHLKTTSVVVIRHIEYIIRLHNKNLLIRDNDITIMSVETM